MKRPSSGSRPQAGFFRRSVDPIGKASIRCVRRQKLRNGDAMPPAGCAARRSTCTKGPLRAPCDVPSLKMLGVRPTTSSVHRLLPSRSASRPSPLRPGAADAAMRARRRPAVCRPLGRHPRVATSISTSRRSAGGPSSQSASGKTVWPERRSTNASPADPGTKSSRRWTGRKPLSLSAAPLRPVGR
jgi:hypothetical protein